jgi:hypothetical protein
MVEETWMPVIGYQNLYEVASTGEVRSVDREIVLLDGKKRKIMGKMLAAKENGDGYLFVTLSRDGKKSTKYLHRAVAEAYMPNPDNLPEINHLSGNKLENSVDNLEWCTHQQNIQHCYDTGLCKNKGADHVFAVGVIDNILGMEFGCIKDWCEARDIKYSTGRNLLNGKGKSKTIDLTAIFKIQKGKVNDGK